MFNQYFGNYLLEKKIITGEQLKDVLEAQKAIRVKLGVLAIDFGYMSAEQVNSVIRMQTIKDSRFGELAIEEGYLTEEKLEELLHSQKKSNVLLGQGLIDKGYFTFEKYEDVLIKYKEDSRFTSEEIAILKNNDIDKIVSMFFKVEDNLNKETYYEYLELFIRNLIRFVDGEIMLEKSEMISSYDYKYIAMQQIQGPLHIFTGFAGDEKTMAKFASIYAEEECAEMNDMAKDSLGEFINCQNGLFLSNLSNVGMELELCPQEIREKGKIVSVEKMYKIPCHLSFGKIDIIISTQVIF